MSDVSTIDVLGFAAAGCVLITFCMGSMRALRWMGIASNLTFIAYAYLEGLVPVLLLHAVLLPVNVYRLAEIGFGRAGKRIAARAVAGLGGLAVGAVAGGIVGGAEAQTLRFVARNGHDANTCSRIAPCRTLQVGIDRSPAGSELVVLDSGDYGDAATIGRSIVISAVGVSATLGGPITINNAGAHVVLRGLRLNGGGVLASGISILAAASVHIDEAEVQNFGRSGIAVNVTANPEVAVTDSVMRNNGADGLSFGAGSAGKLVIENARFEGNGGDGVEVQAGEAAISRSIASGNAGNGFFQGSGGATSLSWAIAANNGADGYSVRASGAITLEESIARGNANGLRATAGGLAHISTSVFTANAVGIAAQNGSTVNTRVNNIVSGNGTDVTGTLTALGGI